MSDSVADSVVHENKLKDQGAIKRRRRCALPAHSKSLPGTDTLDSRARLYENGARISSVNFLNASCEVNMNSIVRVAACFCLVISLAAQLVSQTPQPSPSPSPSPQASPAPSPGPGGTSLPNADP